MKKKIFLGRTPEQEVEEPRRSGVRFVARSREPEIEEPRGRVLRFIAKTPAPPEEEPHRGGIRLIPRSRPGFAGAAPTPPTGSSMASARRQQTPAQTRSRDDSGANPAKIAVALVAVLFLIIIVAALSAASKPQTLTTVPAPHVARSERSDPPERLWMKEYMQQHGPSEELKARRARMGHFQYTGDTSGGRQE